MQLLLEKKISEFKPVKFRLKIDLEPHLTRGGADIKYIYTCVFASIGLFVCAFARPDIDSR